MLINCIWHIIIAYSPWLLVHYKSRIESLGQRLYDLQSLRHFLWFLYRKVCQTLFCLGCVRYLTNVGLFSSQMKEKWLYYGPFSKTLQACEYWSAWSWKSWCGVRSTGGRARQQGVLVLALSCVSLKTPLWARSSGSSVPPRFTSTQNLRI